VYIANGEVSHSGFNGLYISINNHECHQHNIKLLSIVDTTDPEVSSYPKYICFLPHLELCVVFQWSTCSISYMQSDIDSRETWILARMVLNPYFLSVSTQESFNSHRLPLCNSESHLEVFNCISLSGAKIKKYSLHYTTLEKLLKWPNVKFPEWEVEES
jgi:hypothetical protein